MRVVVAASRDTSSPSIIHSGGVAAEGGGGSSIHSAVLGWERNYSTQVRSDRMDYLTKKDENNPLREVLLIPLPLTWTQKVLQIRPHNVLRTAEEIIIYALTQGLSKRFSVIDTINSCCRKIKEKEKKSLTTSFLP